jgi:hypothetical protein
VVVARNNIIGWSHIEIVKGVIMPSITLSVTLSVIQFVAKEGESHRQLAIKDASFDLRENLNKASAANEISVAICGVFTLAVRDNYAIWGLHQVPGVQANDFFYIYLLLEQRPGVEVKFQW